jgi:putative ATP-dependent endonuclease of the OLD family
MYLKSLRIENYRGIREASLTFDETTVLIGENDSGRSSVLEALWLVLGIGSEALTASIKPHHFHRPAGFVAGPIRIVIRFAEKAPGDWKPPARIAAAWRTSLKARREAWLEIKAEPGDVEMPGALHWNLRIFQNGPTLFDCDDELLGWIRRLSPVAWIRGGLTGVFETPVHEHHDLAQPTPLEKVQAHFRNLISGNSPDLVQEIEAGVAAAEACIDAHQANVFETAPLASAMAAEILGRTMDRAGASARSTSVSARKIGMILLLGAIGQIGKLNPASDTRLILVVENPESNLHPMTVAAVWRILQRFKYQKIITTHSGNLLANCPLASIRRLVRGDGMVRQHQVSVRRFSREDLRRVSYHVRSRRASAMFARCWLLVEGESEFWILPELARILGVDFAEEGIVCVEFAQCGIAPLIRLATQLGIEWHVLTDGDDAGKRYEQAALQHGSPARVTRLTELDIENCFWHCGYDEVIRRVAYPSQAPSQGSARRQIQRAIERTSKPFLALTLVEAVGRADSSGVPPALRAAIEACMSLARQSQQSIQQPMRA